MVITNMIQVDNVSNHKFLQFQIVIATVAYWTVPYALVI